MIFKQIFGKTVDAAMKSAKQIYGDDFTVFKTYEGGENQQPGISLIADKKSRTAKSSEKRKKAPVYFEKSQKYGEHKRNPGHTNNELHKLRNIAESQIAKSESKLRSLKSGADDERRSRTKFNPVSSENLTDEAKSVSVYSRKSVHKLEPEISKVNATKFDGESADPVKKTRRTRGLLSRLDESKPNIVKQKTKPPLFGETKTNGINEDKIGALHKRFDKLEALLYSELISVNHEYAAHPVFQQLIQTGIPSKIVSEWFKRIISQNIDPFSNSETFAFHVSKIIRNALVSNSEKKPGQNQLFIGFSGSGKTSLIMKLMLNNGSFEGKKAAVLSVLPDAEKQNNYYTILEPFCYNNEIDYYKIGVDSHLGEIKLDLKEYDHIFIDTPSLSVEKDKAVEEYQKLKRLLVPVSDIDVHLTINMAGNYIDSQNLLINQGLIDADFIALTHLDEIEEWGPVIPLFEKAECSGSYLSYGNSLTKSLKCFDAAWLTKNLLEKTD